jgi:hypothetical protein
MGMIFKVRSKSVLAAAGLSIDADRENAIGWAEANRQAQAGYLAIYVISIRDPAAGGALKTRSFPSTFQVNPCAGDKDTFTDEGTGSNLSSKLETSFRTSFEIDERCFP